MKKRFLSVLLCLCMVVGTAPSMIQPAQAAGNPYPYWQTFTYNGSQYTTITCTYYAWQQVYDRHGIALPLWGNAGSWLAGAQSSGYQTGTEARSGSLAVWGPSAGSSWGHVAYVTAADGGSFTYNEGGTANRRADSLGVYEGHTQPDGYTSWPDGFIYLTASQPVPSQPTDPSSDLPANAAVEAEINDTIERANKISVNTEITGSISKTSDVDWFVFQVPSDGYLSLTFGHDFVDSSYTYWKTAFYTSDNEELNSWLWRGNATSAETGNKIGVPAGTYYLRVSDNSFSSATYRFKVNYTPSGAWEKEFNETIVTANRIPTGTEISGSVRNSSDVDWYAFQVPSGGYISLTFGHDFVDSSYTYWKTAFYTSDNEELNSWLWRGNATSAEAGDKIGVPAGTYYLRVSDNSFSSATYRFTVNCDSSNNPGSGDDQNPVAVSGVTLNKTVLSLTPGSSAVLTAEVTPSDATDKTVVWRSENTAVAAVANGRVTAVGEGSTRITAACGGVTAFCTVSVTAEGTQTRPGGVHFERVNTYFQDQFTDVPANQWYTDKVSNAFELGLMVGDSKTTFDPYGSVTIAQAVTMAARIHSIYINGYENFRQTGDKWYQVYMDYAYQNGIISLAYYNCDVSQKASRAQFAEIFANSLPAEGLSAMNSVADNAIPDVGMQNRYAEYIYKLYRAGILTGSDANGTFNPTTYITRAEAATIVSRMAESDTRVSFTLR